MNNIHLKYKIFACTLVLLLMIYRPIFVVAKIDTNQVILNENTPWLIADGETEAVQRALEDVQKDWYAVFGRLPIVLNKIPDTWKGSVVYFGEKALQSYASEQKHAESNERFFVKFIHDEQSRPAILATGYSSRGAIYGAYQFSETILGIDPWSYWVDKYPKRRNEIKVDTSFNKSFDNPTFKYRGWFINDEDILSKFAMDPMRENVISLEMYGKIYETILRLKGNMVIPATWAMPDERCFELASKRGLILSTSHIQVLGLNTFKWPDSVAYSYSKNPELMEKYWQKCIDAFKDYETIWTVGYRGKFDRPFWAYEPEYDTAEKRGKLMTEAVEKQVELIRKSRPNDPIICNMWSEGADMYQQGFFKLPKGVTIVWADNGQGMMMERGRTKPGDGVYYHSAVMGKNQLSEMIGPNRAWQEVGRLIKAGANSYFMLNVSDIRHYPLSADFCMKMAWDAKPYLDKTPKEAMQDFALDWSKRQYGNANAQQIANLYKRYFNIPYMGEKLQIGESTSAKRVNLLHDRIMKNVDADEMLSEGVINDCKSYLADCKENADFINKLLPDVKKMAENIPADRKDFYKGHLLFQTSIHLPYIEMLKNYCEALLAYQAKNKPLAIQYLQKALVANGGIKDALFSAEYGKWHNWFVGTSLPWNNYTYDEIRILMAKFKGEPEPPIRELRWDPVFYKYQIPFSKNYPLLYPTK